MFRRILVWRQRIVALNRLAAVMGVRFVTTDSVSQDASSAPTGMQDDACADGSPTRQRPPEEVAQLALVADEAAFKLNKMRKMHTAGHPKADRLQLHAWRELQLLRDEHVECAGARSVAQLLNSWVYFSRFWEKGKDGPENPLPTDAAEDIIIDMSSFRGDGSIPNLEDGATVKRRPRLPRNGGDVVHEAPRKNPLDEMIDLD